MFCPLIHVRNTTRMLPSLGLHWAFDIPNRQRLRDGYQPHAPKATTAAA